MQDTNLAASISSQHEANAAMAAEKTAGGHCTDTAPACTVNVELKLQWRTG